MSASTNILTYDYASTSYFGNIAAAASNLLKAVFAVKPRVQSATAPVVSHRSKEASMSWLKRLADDCERHSPSLSAELHFMASRG